MGVWQVLSAGIIFYLAIVAKEVVELLESSIRRPYEFSLFSWTNAAELYHERWKNIGKMELLAELPPFPDYKYEQAGELWVESFDGKIVRPYEPDRDHDVTLRTSRSPLLVEHTVKAACGHAAWKPHFDEMLRP